ncbi:P2X purinoceptor 6 isoform X2 [Antechinus flavipes]|uniref:P2X purinoceptor 6 isoform X2 n=1 Tax=Antechinus flavipes TaxID=38775 RepID=UPI00223689F2|nr:P2X purinoceptor 6 isoform X2 [Antechinus flavipes]
MWNGRAGRGLRTGGVGAGRWLRTGGVRAEGAENGGCQNLGGLRIENWEGPQAPEGGSVIQITQFTTGGPGSQTRKTGFSRGSAPWGPPLLGAVPPCPAPPPRGLQAPGQVGSLPWADGLTAPVLTHGLSMGLLGSLRGWRLLDYKTEKYVLTRNWWVGALQRVLQLGILGYVIGWSLLLQKGYQEKESDPRVSVITKLKGVSVAQMEALGSRVWDVADYTKPPQGENVFFLVTNFLATPGQVQGKCPEHPSVPLAPCLADEDCPAGETLSHSHGIKTGKCVPFNSSYQTCEIWGWCPVESGPVPRSARPAWPWGLPPGSPPPQAPAPGSPGIESCWGIAGLLTCLPVCKMGIPIALCALERDKGAEIPGQGRETERPGLPCWLSRGASRVKGGKPPGGGARLPWVGGEAPMGGLGASMILGSPSRRKPQLLESQNFTLFIKNSITFPKFNFLKANTLETRDGGYFKRCRYHALASPLCPVFRVGDVVAAAGGDFEDLALLGGVVRIQITWDCDLDRPGSECQPRYSFWLQEKGHNFRAAVRWWRPPGREARSLFKLFGIRFEILVAGQGPLPRDQPGLGCCWYAPRPQPPEQGPAGGPRAAPPALGRPVSRGPSLSQAGKFSVIATGITLGTGMALLGAAKAPKGKGGPESTRASALGGRETPGRSRGTAGQAAGEGGPEAARRSPPNDGAAPRGLQGCDSFLESPRTHWETP